MYERSAVGWTPERAKYVLEYHPASESPVVMATRRPIELSQAQYIDSYHLPKGKDMYRFLDIETMKDGSYIPYFASSQWGVAGTTPVSTVSVRQDLVTNAIARSRGRDAALAQASEVVVQRATNGAASAAASSSSSDQ